MNSEDTSYYEDERTTKHYTHDEYFKEDVLKIKSKFKVKKKADDNEPTKDQPDLIEEKKAVIDDTDDFNLLDFGNDTPKEEKPSPPKSKPAKKAINLLENDTMPDEDPLGSLIDDNPVQTTNTDLLPPADDVSHGFEDLSNAFGFTSTPTPVAPPEPPKPQLSLKQTSDMDPNAFQQKWMMLPNYPPVQNKANPNANPNLQAI